MPSVNEDEQLTLTSSFDLPQPIRQSTIPEFLLDKAAEHVRNGKTTYIIDSVSGCTQDYRNFEDYTRRIASAMYKKGLRKGSSVVYTTYGIANAHVFFTGVWRANGFLRSSYAVDNEESLMKRVEEMKARWILCEAKDASQILSVCSTIPWQIEVITMGVADGCTSFAELLMDDGSSCPKLEIEGNDPAFVLQTSGTTGKSKGAILTHKSVLNMTEKFLQWPWGDTNLFVFKGDQIRGATNPIATFAAGKLAVCLLTISGLELLKAVDKYRPSFVRGSPTWLLEMLNCHDNYPEYDLTSIKIVSLGGVCITPALQKTFLQLTNITSIMITYGMTECTPVALSGEMYEGEWRTIPGKPNFSVGKLAPLCSIQIRDTETSALLGPYQKGEICVKSNSMFSGYFNLPEETARAFIDGDYMKTGDYGYYDENNFLFVVDRCKETFKYNGNHISPTELEELLCQHPDVALASVFGIPDPDGLYYIPRAFVTLKKGALMTSAHDIKLFANSRLPNYQHLRGGVFIVNSLPLGKSGKISRQLVAQLPLPTISAN